MNTTENNKLIAEFMGMKQDPESGNYMLPHYSSKYVINHLTKGRNYDEWADRYTDENYNTGYLLPLDYLEYHSSFDWLLEVVEKIKNIVLLKGITFTNQLIAGLITVNKEAVYNAVVEFIKWYNLQLNIKKWNYSCTTNTIWTSFDYGEVEAETYEEAYEKALERLKYDVEKVNHVLQSADVTAEYSIEFDYSQLSIEEIE